MKGIIEIAEKRFGKKAELKLKTIYPPHPKQEPLLIWVIYKNGITIGEGIEIKDAFDDAYRNTNSPTDRCLKCCHYQNTDKCKECDNWKVRKTISEVK